MAKIPDEIVKHIEDVARIEDVVGDFVTLRRAGVNLTGLCPFHDDRHDGNFIVRPSSVPENRGGNTYRCFVCEKKGGVVKFLMEAEHMSFPDAVRYLGRKYCIPVDDVPVNWTPPPPRPVPPPLPRLTFKRKTVKDSMNGVEQTMLVRWLRSLPWNDEQQARLTEVLRLYCVARCPHGPEWVTFWQISHDGVPLTAKYMRYHADGHRVKDRDELGNKVFATDWEHAWRARMRQYDPDKWDTSSRSLFGCHLLARYPQAEVNVVESEKTALIMATRYGRLDKQLWLACGGLRFLQLDMLQPLIDQGRTVWLWPDKDGAGDWEKIADKLGYDKCKVYTQFYKTCWKEEDGQKADCSDIIIRMMETGEKPRRDTGDGQTPSELRTAACSAPTPETLEWNSDEPFLDEEEIHDHRILDWRDKLRRAHKMKHNFPSADTITAVEVLQQHPELESLL